MCIRDRDAAVPNNFEGYTMQLGYKYKNKYLVDLNMAYNGTDPVSYTHLDVYKRQVVDGVQRELYSIDPDAIESVSIQKDALSSMFGTGRGQDRSGEAARKAARPAAEGRGN